MRRQFGWSIANLLLLTATPHMGKDFPYDCFWRLLAPDMLATPDAYNRFPNEKRHHYLIRRTKEEMVGAEGRPLLPRQRCDTLSFTPSSAEQHHYHAISRYLTKSRNNAQNLDRSAARLALSIFQHRMVSSTNALMKSFVRRFSDWMTLSNSPRKAASVNRKDTNTALRVCMNFLKPELLTRIKVMTANQDVTPSTPGAHRTGIGWHG